MKKYMAVLLCFAFIIGIASPLNIVQAAYGDDENVAKPPVTDATTLVAEKKTVDVTSLEGWGEPVIHVDQTSENTKLYQHYAEPEAVSMDIYTYWDDTNLYLRVISPDSDVRAAGKDEGWTGDGMQFKLNVGSTITSNTKDFYYTLGAKDASKTNVGSGSGVADEAAVQTYQRDFKVQDGKLYISIAIPLSDLGLDTATMQNCTKIAFNMIRISGTKKHVYAGWLAYGPFFGVGNAYNEGATETNTIILYDKDAPLPPPEKEVQDGLKAFTKESNVYAPEAGADLLFGLSSSDKLVSTADGTYALYVSFPTIFPDKGNGTAMTEFSLQKIGIGSEKSYEIGYSYVYNGIPNLTADKDGNVYVVGGGSNWDIDKFSSRYNYLDSPAEAILYMWKYDPDTNGLYGYREYRDFTLQAKGGYIFAASATDNAAGKIYSVFLGKNAEGQYAYVECFTFDMATMTWDDGSTALEITPVVAVESISASIADGKLNIVYVAESGTYAIENGQLLAIPVEGKQIDTEYVNGTYYALNADGEGKLSSLKVVEENVTTNALDISTSDFDARYVALNGNIYVAAISKAGPVTIKLFNADDGSEVLTKELSPDITYRSAFSVTISPDGSTFEFIFAGYSNNVFAWYYGAEKPVQE